MAESCTPKFLAMAKALKESKTFEYPNLKAMFLGQCILECGRGTTKLFSDYSNPFGMHFFDWMSEYATGVEYEACDGVAVYSKFDSWENVFKAYFAWFKHWSHYAGWEKETGTPIQFLNFIAPHYCPPAYTKEWVAAHSNKNYGQYIVDLLLPEAEKILSGFVDPIPVSDKDLTVTWYEFNRRTSNGESTITAYAGDTPKYTHKVTTISDLWTWSQHFPNAQNCPVADTAIKVIPKVPDFGEVKPLPKPEPVTHDYVPFSKRTNSIMPVRATKNPKYLIWHWTCGSPDSTGEDTISWGKSQGYTYAALDAKGQLWQSVKTTQGGYHTGEGIVDSTECYGVEVICAGKVEKINGLYVPWFAKKDDGTIDKARCIPESEINYDPDNFDSDHSFQGYYHAFTSAQISTILRTCLYFMETYNIPIENIRDHAEVARPLGRKTDIGFSYKGGIVKLRKDVQSLWDSGKRWNNY